MCVHEDDAVITPRYCLMHEPKPSALHNWEHYCIRVHHIKTQKASYVCYECCISGPMTFDQLPVLTATNASFKMSLIWTNKWICKKYHPHGKHIHVPKTVPVTPPLYLEGCSSCCGRSELEKKLEVNPRWVSSVAVYGPILVPHLCHHLGMHLCVLIVPIRYEYLNIAQDLINNRNIHSSSHNKNSTTQLAGTSMQLQNKFSLQPHSFCLLGPWVNQGNNPVQCQIKVGHRLDMIYDCIQVSGNLHAECDSKWSPQLQCWAHTTPHICHI